MKYQVDSQTMSLIRQLCDLALKSGGLQNKPAVDFLLGRFEEKKDEKG